MPANVSSTGATNTYFVTAWATDSCRQLRHVAQSLSFSIPPAGSAYCPAVFVVTWPEFRSLRSKIFAKIFSVELGTRVNEPV